LKGPSTSWPQGIGPQNYKEQTELATTEAPNVLRRLFVELASIPQRELESVLDVPTLKSFLALDLLRLSLDQDQYYAPVFLYPIAGLIIASDRYNGPPGLPLFKESVYPAIESHSLRLLDFLPRRHISAALDLGTGSGIYALTPQPARGLRGGSGHQSARRPFC
jgi:hypothetical protein